MVSCMDHLYPDNYIIYIFLYITIIIQQNFARRYLNKEHNYLGWQMSNNTIIQMQCLLKYSMFVYFLLVVQANYKKNYF